MKRIVSVSAIVCLVFFIGQAVLAQEVFNDATKANVLRQFNTAGVNLVTATYDVSAGVGIESRGGIDGSLTKDQFGSLDAVTKTATVTFQLPGARTIGSCNAILGDFQAASFVLQGWNGTEWVELMNAAEPATGTKTGTFDDVAVSKIRYVVTAKDGGTYYQVRELYVYEASSQTVKLTDGFNYLVDQYSTTTASAGNAVWGNVDVKGYLYDGTVSSWVKGSNSAQGGNRAFITFAFAEAVPMKCGSLGWYESQSWGNWECYTANGEFMPDLQGLAASNSDTITAAGWTLQTSKTPAAGNPANFMFDTPGGYQYLAIVWDSQGDAAVELEVFGPIVHTVVDTFALADPVTNSTTYTNVSALKVAAFTATPSELGTSIVAYAVNDTGFAPADGDPAWSATVPETFTIGDVTGLHTVYGYAKDDTGDVGMKICTIMYRSPADVLTFNDSSKINVLRQFDTAGTNLVTATFDLVGCGIGGNYRGGSFDGSGNKDQFDNFNSINDTATVTYQLPGPRTVSSVKAILGGYAVTSFIVQGWDGAQWVEFLNVTAPALTTGTQANSFAEVTVTKVRYIVNAKDGGDYFQMYELYVYMAPGQTVKLVDGYNSMVDQNPAGLASAASSSWAVPGSTTVLKNGVVRDGVSAQSISPLGGNRAFLAYSFVEPVPMKSAALGSWEDQTWNNWECYTANGDTMPPLQSLGNDTTSITDAGWTLQHSHGTGGQVMAFVFSNPGDYKYIALVWNVQYGSTAEFELFASITHTTVTSFAVADPVTSSTTYTKSTTLNAVGLEATPSQTGSSIVAYAVSENEIPPPDGDAWSALPPMTCTIADVSGMHTVYGFAKDNTGDIGRKAATIFYRSPSESPVFADSTKVNVLRQYSTAGVNTVTATYETVGCSLSFVGSTDGSANKDQVDGFGLDPISGAADTFTVTYRLPGPRTVSSLRAQLGSVAASFKIEAWDGAQWTELLNKDDASATYTAAFDAITVSKIRYVAVARPDSIFFQVRELCLYMAPGQTVKLTDGHNYIVDQNPAMSTCTNNSVWAAPADNIANLKDGTIESYVRASGGGGAGSRSFVIFTFTEPVQMRCGSLGFYVDQNWGNWECYTASGDTPPAMQGLPSNAISIITEAGWILQHAEGPRPREASDFTLSNPGEYKHLALVWDATGGACVELELFAPLARTTVTGFAVADRVSLSTTFTKNPIVDVIVLTATPSELGTAITGYMVTDSDVAPEATDPNWQVLPPLTFMLTGATGTKTLYGWARDDQNDIGMKTCTIFFRSPADPQTMNPAKANVLRQYDAATATNLVTVSRELVACSLQTAAINDGSGLAEQLGNWSTEFAAATWTFTLPGDRTVGSYMMELPGSNYLPVTLTLETVVDGYWVPIATPTPAQGRLAGTFDAPVTTSQLRLKAAGQGGADPYLLITELEVYLAPDQTVLITDGYDYLRDVTPSATSQSVDSAAWATLTGGGPNDLRDIDYGSHVKALNVAPDGGTRAFVTFSFTEPVPMAAATLGNYHGQPWKNWEVYTAMGDAMPPLQSLEASTSQAITDSGWKLQFANAPATQAKDFAFNEPGDYQHIAIVWDVQGNAAVQFELRGASLAPRIRTFSLADRTSGSKLVTNESVVDVILAMEPDDAEVDYIVSEAPDQPALDSQAWGAKPATFTIAGAQGNVTVYAWTKDTLGNMAGKTAGILYTTAQPVVSNAQVVTGAEPTTAVVTWETDIPTEGSVLSGVVSLIGTTPNAAREAAVGTSHSVTIPGFDISKNHKFVIVNNEIALPPPALYWPSRWPIPCDVNKDCKVNILDLISIRNKLNQLVSTGDNIYADVNLPAPDGKINILDLIAVRNKLNTQCP